MEDCLPDQPQEVVGSRPELGDICQALCPIVEKVDLTDHISEAEYKTAADQGRDQRSENLAQSAHDLLERVLVCLGCGFYRILAHAFDPCVSSKFVVKYGNIISDDDLILTCLGECPLYARQILNCLFVRFLRIHKNKTHPCHTVGDSLNVFLPSDKGQ